MSEKMQETIADIVEAMKRRKEMLEDAAFNAPLCYSTETMKAQCEILDELIERFEAAHGRELSKNASKNGADFGQLGDAAKLREALEPWIAFAEWLLENAGKDGLGKAIQENGPIIRQRLEELRGALAAPPRNCNVFSTKDTAREAFQKLRGHRVLADVSLWDDREESEARK